MKKISMLLSGDTVDPARTQQLMEEDSRFMIPDDRVDLRRPILGLSTTMNQSSSFQTPSRFGCCSDGSINRDLNLSGGSQGENRQAPRPIMKMPEAERPVLKSSRRPPKSRSNSMRDYGRDSDEETERQIEERVSQKLTQEFLQMQKHKEQAFMSEIKKQRSIHQLKQQALQSQIIQQDLEIERKNKLIRKNQMLLHEQQLQQEREEQEERERQLEL